jgi:Asp-tRNA(Asn)/Glu-tRNA(Gln) amidotransferase A subunit family amidase
VHGPPRAVPIRRAPADRPLLGVPVTVKESYNIAGLPTTWGMPLHRNYMPAEDAVQVSRLTTLIAMPPPRSRAVRVRSR